MKKVTKPFDLEAAKNGAKVETRNGHKVEILRSDLKNICPIIGIVTGDDGSEGFCGWKIDGTSPVKMIGDDSNDLVIVEYEDEDKESKDTRILNNIEECLKPFYDKSEYKEIYEWIEKKKDESLRNECPESWWVARDKDGEVFIYNSEPIRLESEFRLDGDSFLGHCAVLHNRLFPEITWENSPKKIIMVSLD